MFARRGTSVRLARLATKRRLERGNAVPYYEFRLIGGDGARLSRERHPAADLETVWDRVFRMAEFGTERGRQIQVLDERGRIAIGIGAKAAALSARRFRVLPDRSRGGWGEGGRTS
jgi:hypothetical protein